MSVAVSGLSLSIGGKQLLKDISFTAPAGQVTGLIGPNGAGKSTLLAALAGDLDYQGTARLAGVDPAATSAAELARVRAVMLQDVSVSFAFAARDVVAMGRRPWAKESTPEEDQRHVARAMAAMEVEHLADRDVMTLSGGERARVALARVLAQQTPVIFLDEPTAALDISHQEQAMCMVRDVAAAGAAVVVVLHDLNLAAAYCDHIVCLKNGQVAAAGSIDQVYTSAILTQVYDWPIHVLRAGQVPGWDEDVLHVVPAHRRPAAAAK